MGQKRFCQCPVVREHSPWAGSQILFHCLTVWSKGTCEEAGNYWWKYKQWYLLSCQGWGKPLALPLDDQWQLVYVDSLMWRCWYLRPGVWLFCQRVYQVYLSSVVDIPVSLPFHFYTMHNYWCICGYPYSQPSSNIDVWWDDGFSLLPGVVIHHHSNSSEHLISPECFTIVEREPQGVTRDIKEVMYIHVNDSSPNRNLWKYQLLYIWDQALQETLALQLK